MVQDWSGPSVEEVIQVKERVAAEILDRPGVTGVGAGLKMIEGQLTNDCAIIVFVAEKREGLSKGEAIPQSIDGIRTDVIEATCQPCATASEWFKSPGMGIKTRIHGQWITSSFGAIAVERVSGRRVGLTSWHPTPIFPHMPANGDTVDLGTRPGKVLSSRYDSGMNAGTFSLPSANIDPSISGLGYLHGRMGAYPGMQIVKCGASTGITRGAVQCVACDTIFNKGSATALAMANLIVVRSFNGARMLAAGDSGSLAVCEMWRGPTALHVQRYAVGLVLAEDMHGFQAWIMPIDRVEQEMQLRLVTRPYLPPDRHVPRTVAGTGWASGESLSEQMREISSALTVVEAAAAMSESASRDAIIRAAFDRIATTSKRATHEDESADETAIAEC